MPRHRIPPKIKIEKRLVEFKKWLSDFQNIGNFEYRCGIDEMANILNEWYWHRIESDVWPFMDISDGEFTNHSKIISGIELSIMACRPLSHFNGQQLDAKEASEKNAFLAWYIVLSILSDWKNIEDSEVLDDIFTKNEELIKFQREHLVWLELLDIEFSYPIISNAQTIRLLSYIIDIHLNQI